MKLEPGIMSRNVLSKKTGVKGETIRYYENVGLMPEPDRAPNGYRIYQESHVKRLVFIRKCRELGFKQREIATLLRLVDGGDYTCEEVRAHALGRIREIDARLQDLRKIRQTLADLAERCENDQVPECPIVETLFET